MTIEDVVDRIAAVTRAVPGVSGLHAGSFDEVATYLPGRRVPGVRLLEDRTEVHITVELDRPLMGVAEAVREAVTPMSPGPVSVVVEDVTAPGEAVPEVPRPSTPSAVPPLEPPAVPPGDPTA